MLMLYAVYQWTMITTVVRNQNTICILEQQQLDHLFEDIKHETSNNSALLEILQYMNDLFQHAYSCYIYIPIQEQYIS